MAAAWLAGNAHRSAELHQRLVEAAGVGLRDEPCRERPNLFHARGRAHVALQGEDAREDARHVAVDERGPLAERDARDRARRVRSDTRDLTEGGDVAREVAAV